MMLTQLRLPEVLPGQTGKATTAATTSGGRGWICVCLGCPKKCLGCKLQTLAEMGRKVYVRICRYMSVEESLLIKFGKLGFLKHHCFFLAVLLLPHHGVTCQPPSKHPPPGCLDMTGPPDGRPRKNLPMR